MAERPSGESPFRVTTQPFRPRARLLQLLGDELIGSPRLAVFELVKNAYDADATKATVRLDVLREQEPSITVTDDGEGMSLQVLTSIWLVPGDDHRQRQRLSNRRTPKHGRLPVGEKGLGRFAVHKLGNRIQLVTRSRDADECVVEIAWDQLISQPYLDQAPVRIRERPPEVFLDGRTGTQIEIRQMRESNWSRREVRRLHSQITSICSPFEEPSGFQAVLEVPGREDWVADLPDVARMVDQAPWKFSFRADGGTFDWEYVFRQIPGLPLGGRHASQLGDRLVVEPADGDRTSKRPTADLSTFSGIGPISGELYVYDREHEIRRRMANIRVLERYLDETGGIRVYRDGIRVYNYGERGDDWLGLDLRRVNKPTMRVSRNLVLGAIHLSVQRSTGLVEKTNREGFVENNPCRNLRRIVLGAISVLETERGIDKDRIRKLTKSPTNPTVTSIDKPIDKLRQALARQDILNRFDPHLKEIERHYLQMEEIFLSAGMAGLNLALVFHEIERGIGTLHRMIVDRSNIDGLERQARELVRLLDGFSVLLRRDSVGQHSARKLVAAAQQNTALRLRYHRVNFLCPLLEGKDEGFRARFAFSLGLGALTNLIDNALYWLRVRWPMDGERTSVCDRRLYVGVSQEFESGPAIVVADNGTGLRDDPQHLIRPFFTRKPAGMGLGLYYANLAMTFNEGQLVFPDPTAVTVPDGFDGAVVALVFGELK